MAWEWIDLDGVDASEPSGYVPPKPGNYVCVITGHEENEERRQQWLTVDVAEGPCMGMYQDAEPRRHRILISMKNLGFAKAKLQTISKGNPGFDAAAALRNPDLFVGRFVGLGLGVETSTNLATGKSYTDHDFFHATLGTPEDARAGRLKVPEPTSRTYGEAPSGGLYDSDVPF